MRNTLIGKNQPIKKYYQAYFMCFNYLLNMCKASYACATCVEPHVHFMCNMCSVHSSPITCTFVTHET